jgi:hypothetical protein
MDFVFPSDCSTQRSSLIVCSSWAQAENISTERHKAVTCHNATSMMVQSLRNAHMQPGDKKPTLEKKWGHLRLLVAEEVSMISPALYNMLLYRSFHGRRGAWDVREAEYDKLRGAFGRMPIVIHLGDFLQLRPTANISLLEDLLAREDAGGRDIPPEEQAACKLFMQIPLCFELQQTNRFKDDRLRALMAFMRSPAAAVPAHIARSWEQIQAKGQGHPTGTLDPRLQDSRFQTGHMLGIFWETVGRWVMMRARRDAAVLQTPLFLLQAADTASPPLTREMTAKLLNHYNPHETGHMHGMFAAHLGMRVRFLAPLDKTKGLVQEAEGVVVHIAVHPQEQDSVDAAFASNAKQLYLTQVPLGLWLKMDKYTGAPFVQLLQDTDATLSPAVTDSLVFLAPTATVRPFKWRDHTISRVGFALSHANVRTSTACQGKTLEGGVVIDCARKVDGQHPMDDDRWWLHLYVMLSRATSLDDLLLLRAPGPEFLLRGPPKDLQQKLRIFASRVEACRERALGLAADLGLDKFLH